MASFAFNVQLCDVYPKSVQLPSSPEEPHATLDFTFTFPFFAQAHAVLHISINTHTLTYIHIDALKHEHTLPAGLGWIRGPLAYRLNKLQHCSVVVTPSLWD